MTDTAIHEMRSGWLPWITSITTIASSLATFGAFVFAIWAYNFSSIPEQIAARFNSDIASLNEQLIDLRRERRNLADRLSQERQEFQVSMREREDAIARLNEAKTIIGQQINDLETEKPAFRQV